MKKIYYSIILFSLFGLFRTESVAQGIGNHLTFTMTNCAQTANSIQFDMYVVSDGAANSDLRMAEADFDIYFDSCLLQNGPP